MSTHSWARSCAKTRQLHTHALRPRCLARLTQRVIVGRNWGDVKLHGLNRRVSFLNAERMTRAPTRLDTRLCDHIAGRLSAPRILRFHLKRIRSPLGRSAKRGYYLEPDRRDDTQRISNSLRSL